MRLHIRFFATIRDRAGVERTTLELDEAASVASLIDVLSQQYPTLAPALPSALIAVNQEYAFRESSLNDGDEVAIFPPVSGGVGGSEWPEYYAVTADHLNVDQIIQFITRPETGAVAVFAGAVRGVTHKPGAPENTNHLFYEAYEPMAEKTLRQVAAEMRERYPKIQGVAVVQRIGQLKVGETTILVACSSGHRNDGIFEAAHYGINRVKEIVPVWKKEVGPDGEVWIEGEYRPTQADVETSVETFVIGCSSCGENYPLDTRQLSCECGELLEFISSPPFNPAQIEGTQSSMWRYREMLLPADITPVSLGEGWTPLLEIANDGSRVFAKLEGLNPSGSFKDRGAALLTSILKRYEINAVHDDSSGNAGAALAAYAARAGMQARLYVPEEASATKLAQIALYGAELIPVEGPRSAATEAALKAASSERNYYASHVRHPAPILAYKSTAWEIWEQLGRKVPDAVVVPVGQGSQLLGIADGFRDLIRAGVISIMPRLFGIQAENCAPLAQHEGGSLAANEGETLAEGIRVAHPIRQERVLQVIRDSQGEVITVSENEILDGFAQLAEQGIFAEPTSAVVWPALARIKRSPIKKSLPNNATIVLIISGSGLKSSHLEQLTQHVRRLNQTRVL